MAAIVGGTSIAFDVSGLPPVKNEAKSLLASDHVHAARVLALLEAARTAIASSDWQSAADASLGMELILTSPGPPLSDATNYLGGVGDVLEDKGRRGELTHLGELAQVALYANDRMIHEVSYRWEQGEGPRYSIRLWTR